MGTRGSIWTAGISFPVSPVTGDSHLFTAAVVSGLTWQDAMGMALTSAELGDVARYNGTAWTEVTNIRGTMGTAGSSGTDGDRGSLWVCG